MKRLLVVSDSHGDANGLRLILEKAWGAYGHFDAVLHCGDGAGDLERLTSAIMERNPRAWIMGVRGNWDQYDAPDLPKERVGQFDHTRIFMTHGHRLAVRNSLLLLEDAVNANECTIGLFGHIHRQVSEMRSVLLLNPGCAYTGQYLVLELEDGVQPQIHLEQLKEPHIPRMD